MRAHSPPDASSVHPRLWRALAILLALVVFAGAAAAWRARRLRARPGEGPVAAPRVTPIAPDDRVSARRGLVAAAVRARTHGDFARAAALEAVLAGEALARAARVERAWRDARDPATGLLPRSLDGPRPIWNAKDTAADLFPHLLAAARLLDPSAGPIWLDTLAADRRLLGPWSGTLVLGERGGTPVAEPDATRVFGAAEYAKDGLLPLVERFGEGPWLDRLREIADAVLDGAHGRVPSSVAEVNGDLLQVLSRLSWATREPRYVEATERIALAYLFVAAPANDGLVPQGFDFEAGRVTDPRARFRDHGNEVLVGLAEAYALAKGLGRPRAAEQGEALRRLLARSLEVGRTPEGLFVSMVDASSGRVLDPSPSDNYGYLLAAYHTVDLADGTRTYAAEIERTLRAVARLRSFRWEGDAQDGYADALESMLYLLPWFPIAECESWVDDQAEVLFSKQHASGFVEGRYLDGNFIRTALLYAGWKARGAAVEPWREDAVVGAAFDRARGVLFVRVEAGGAYEGRLRLDGPRHRLHLSLPFEHPRLNAVPEWFVVEPEARYEVQWLDEGGLDAPMSTESWTVRGADLAEGLPIGFSAPSGGGRSLAVRRRE